MLGAIAFILIIFWLLRLMTSETMGGFIQFLLVIALMMVLLLFIGSRSVY